MRSVGQFATMYALDDNDRLWPSDFYRWPGETNDTTGGPLFQDWAYRWANLTRRDGWADLWVRGQRGRGVRVPVEQAAELRRSGDRGSAGLPGLRTRFPETELVFTLTRSVGVGGAVPRAPGVAARGVRVGAPSSRARSSRWRTQVVRFDSLPDVFRREHVLELGDPGRAVRELDEFRSGTRGRRISWGLTLRQFEPPNLESETTIDADLDEWSSDWRSRRR
ncbi:MAG: hypothetical protein R3B49_10825 [Phycisphaerales bacterium]